MLEAKKIDESKALREHLPQLYDYLRRLCLEHRYRHLCGVLTNYRTWIFVKYDFEREIETVQNFKSSAAGPGQVVARFEVCTEMVILDAVFQLLPAGLERVLDTIDLCCTVLGPEQTH